MRMVLLENKYQDTSGFGRVPDPPDVMECEPEEDFDEDNCYFCASYDECKEEYGENADETDD